MTITNAKTAREEKKLLTYCSVDRRARKFPSFPLDHLLTSASKDSANLCNDISTKDGQRGQVRIINLYFGMKGSFLHFFLLALFEQEDHACSFLQELLPELHVTVTSLIFSNPYPEKIS